MRQVVAQAGLVVMIAAMRESSLEFLGSGFVCSTKGHILTCAHMLDLTAKLHMIVPPSIDSFSPLTSQQVNAMPIKLVQLDAENDVALLIADGNLTVQLMPNFIGRGEVAQVGETVGCLGVPFGDRGLHTLKLTSTVICGKSVTASNSKRLNIDANMHRGNSGGPVLLAKSGQVIGLVAERFSPVGSEPSIMIGNMPLGADSTISFAIPIEYSFPLLKEEGINV